MNERTPPPKLENIAAAVKFSEQPSTEHAGRTRLIASLHVASSCWFSEHEARKHPDIMPVLREKLKRHLLRQLYHDQIAEMHEAVSDFMRGWIPGRCIVDGTERDPFSIRDRLMKAARYTPPPGFDDDEFDCNQGPNCGCEQFEFLLQLSPKRTSRD